MEAMPELAIGILYTGTVKGKEHSLRQLSMQLRIIFTNKRTYNYIYAYNQRAL